MRSELDVPVVLVMEYFQPFAIPNTSENANGTDTALFDPTTAAGQHRLELVGSMVCFDCLINNSDRVPVAWDNEGNRGNILISGRSP